MEDDQFLTPRRCLLEPISEIRDAQSILDAAAEAHILGDAVLADVLLRKANTRVLANWTDAIWGKHNRDILRVRCVPHAPLKLRREEYPRPRMPTAAVKKQVIERDGYHCRFCGIPVIDPFIRKMLHTVYPDAVPWGRTNSTQHAAFQCMWLQYDHVLPNSRGGESTFDNVIVTCAPCNFGRMERTLDEVGLIDPRLSVIAAARWDGLERLRGMVRSVSST